MKQLNRARMNWYGLKPAVRGVMVQPWVNPLALRIARTLLPMRLASRLPVARHSVSFRPGNGTSVEMFEPERCDVAKDLYWGGAPA